MTGGLCRKGLGREGKGKEGKGKEQSEQNGRQGRRGQGTRDGEVGRKKKNKGSVFNPFDQSKERSCQQCQHMT